MPAMATQAISWSGNSRGLVAPGQPTLLLRDVREVSRELSDATRTNVGQHGEISRGGSCRSKRAKRTSPNLAQRHGVEADVLAAWLDYLGLSSSGPVKIEGHFTDTFTNGSGFAFINGWGKSGTPNLAANSSDSARAHSRQHEAAQRRGASFSETGSGRRLAQSGRRPRSRGRDDSARASRVRQRRDLVAGIAARSKRQRLATGIAQGAKEVKPAPIENLAVQPGDLVSLLIGPRDGNHSCDLTAVDLTLTTSGRRRTRMESGEGCFARRARRQPARRPFRQRRRLALLHRAGQEAGRSGR